MVEFSTTYQHDITDQTVVCRQVALITLSPTSVSAELSGSLCPAVQELCKAFGKITSSQLQIIIPVPIQVPTEA